MSQIKSWLSAAVENDLQLATLWKRVGTDQNGFLNDTSDLVRRNPSLAKQAQEVQERHSQSDFDLDCDRFLIGRSGCGLEGGMVQLVRFLAKSGTVGAVISDGQASTHVKFKLKALQDYFNRRKTNFTDIPEGTLLLLKEFNIRIAPSDLPYEQVSLLILDVDSLGLQQPPIGQPVLLTEIPSVKSAFDALCTPSPQPAVTSSVEEPSQAPEQPPSSGRVASQAAQESAEEPLHTQYLGGPPSPASVTSQIVQDSTDSQHFETQLPFGSSFLASVPPQPTAFLDFVSKKSVSVVDQQRPAKASDGLTLQAIGSKAPSPDPVATAQEKDERFQGSDVNTPEKHLSSQGVHQTEEKQTETKDQVQSLPREQRLPDVPVPRAQNQQQAESSQSLVRNSCTEEPASVASKHEPWSGVTVPLPNMAVPKDQQEILSRSHSWYPAEPGKAFPTGNVPRAVLQWAEEQAQRKSMSVEEPVSPSKGEGQDAMQDAIEPNDEAEAEGDSSDESLLPWDASSEASEDEDDSKSSIDPTPTMPSPLKISRAVRDPLPPDSSLPSPSSQAFPRRPVLPVDSDDDIEVGEPLARSVSPPNEMAQIGIQTTEIDLSTSRAPTATAETLPFSSLDGVMDSALRPIMSTFINGTKRLVSGSSLGGRRKGEEEAGVSDAQVQEEAPKSVSRPNGSQQEILATTAELAGSQQPSDTLPVVDAVADSVNEASSGLAAPRDDIAPSQNSQTLGAFTQLERQPSAGLTKNSQSSNGDQVPSLQAMEVDTPISAKNSQAAGQPNVEESSAAETENHQTPPPAVTFVQSTYPERSAQKRKHIDEEMRSSPPKRARQERKSFGFSQDTSVGEDHREAARQRKKDFLRQYEERKRAAFQDPAVSADDSTSQEGSRVADKNVTAIRNIATPAIAARKERIRSPVSSNRPAQAQRTDETPSPRRGNTPSGPLAALGVKRELPWKQTPPAQGMDKSSRPTPVALASSPPLLAGWRARLAQASAVRSSPQPNAARSYQTRTAVSGSANTSPRVDSAPVSRPSSRLGTQTLQVAPAKSPPQQTRHRPGSTVPVSHVSPARLSHPVASSGAQSRQLASPRSSKRQRPAESAVEPSQPLTQPRPPHVGPPMPSTGQPADEASQIDGPVVDLYRDFQKLRNVQRDLGAVEAEMRRRHTKRWSVLDWTLQ